MSEPRALTCESYALFCDEYELTMAQSFWRHRQNGRVCFEVTVRHLPPGRGYLVVAGLEQVLAQLCGLRFSDADLAYLERIGFEPGFTAFLRGLRFTGDVHAIAEGTVAGAGTPLLRVTAPRIEAMLVESALLAIVNHQTSIASKTARVVAAARGRDVWDFSLRRVHGPEAGLAVARAAYIAGAAGTATEVAGQRLGIPTSGTMAHHFVMAFGPDREQQGFEQFLRDYPGRATLLVDTYDTLRGVDHAIAASRSTGVALTGVRIDSGDIASLAKAARARFDAAGMPGVRILASGDLDEHRITELLDAGAPVDAFGVGTMLGTSYDAPALGGVFKLVAQEEDGALQPVMKRSAGKLTDPGVHQVFRTADGDVVGMDGEGVDGEPLLRQVMRGGVPGDIPSLDAGRLHCAAQRARIPDAQARLIDPAPWPVRRSPQLEALRDRLGGDGDRRDA
ncbi:MAG: nicotinate phosphoribosyltransferase [Candidatus Dormibacteraeota bacterium]|nr:nicotinate phosphoribosyltransferase [Candidatus Dormibacteraeota bacterium]MBV9526060.1 nicotinate phosphoribosyltransferase [Candidatus Dormibacteraeota bacterium]